MLREARVAAQLHHPNVVALHDLFRVDGQPYLVMQYVDGESLDERLRRIGSLSVMEGAPVFAQVASALAAAHRAGIVHRDVKPANILLGTDGEARLADIGIARSAGDVVASSASDIWSLGATMFMALDGHPPFTDTNQTMLLVKLVTETAPSAERAGPLAELISAMLAGEPAARPSAAGVATRLPAAVAAVAATSTVVTRTNDESTWPVEPAGFEEPTRMRPVPDRKTAETATDETVTRSAVNGDATLVRPEPSPGIGTSRGHTPRTSAVIGAMLVLAAVVTTVALLASSSGSHSAAHSSGSMTPAAQSSASTEPTTIRRSDLGRPSSSTPRANATLPVRPTRVVKTIAVGHGPVDVTINPRGRAAYIADFGPNFDFTGDTVSVFDLAANAVTASVKVGDAPSAVAISPSGRTAYVTNMGGSTASVINTTTFPQAVACVFCRAVSSHRATWLDLSTLVPMRAAGCGDSSQPFSFGPG